MTKHFHLVVRSSSQELWQLMKPLNTGYAAYHKHKQTVLRGFAGPIEKAQLLVFSFCDFGSRKGWERNRHTTTG